MFWIIFNTITGGVFMILSLYLFFGLVLHTDEFTQGQLLNMAGLSVAFTVAWVWSFKQVGENIYILKSNRN
ncbi:hypothetical protein D3G56_17920 [Escherichia coli]|nr:hypothetical protein [Escherichia coli]